ncbi:MAG: TIGR03086 family metal-binding protein [Candidatus Dormiibacterota bacterium]
MSEIPPVIADCDRAFAAVQRLVELVRPDHTGNLVHAAFLTPGFLDGKVDAPLMGEQQGTTIVHMRINELLVHGWDLAHAIGQPADLPEDLAAGALILWQHRLAGRSRDVMPFDAPVAVAEDAPAIDRLAAFLGRQP